MHSLSDKFYTLFEGLDRAHGTLVADGTLKERSSGAKVGGKFFISHHPVTPMLWSDHLEGSKSLGIFPLNDHGVCRWGAIDVDQYDQDLAVLARRLGKDKLPVTLMRSKSGGAHLYLFTREWVPAELMQRKLREIAAYLGFSSGEVFPKQQVLVKERDDTGNCLNMPYFDAAKGTRYALAEDGAALSATDFIAAAEARLLTQKQLDEYRVPQGAHFTDGPPCLQTMDLQGVTEGNRNSFMFQAAVYWKRKFPEDWKKEMEKYNKERMEVSLPAGEVKTIQTQLEKKEYFYMCSKAPFCNMCNNASCKTRKFGVGHKALPLITGLTKLDSRPAIWFMTVEGEPLPLELSTEDLMNQGNMRKQFMEQMNIIIPTVKREMWDEVLATLNQKLQIIAVSEDSSVRGYAKELIEKFCTGRNQAREKDDIILGRPWHDESAAKHWFKLSDLVTFMEKHKFKEMGRHQIANTVREMRGGHAGVRLKKVFVNLWWVPEFLKKEDEAKHDMTKL